MLNVADAPNPETLPSQIPLFPLSGVLLLPRGVLPLNIFEQRYKAMVEDALRTPDRLIGMIQPRIAREGLSGDTDPLYETGCAGRMTGFEETDDGRYLITLKGISRFRVKKENGLQRGYRRADVDWSPFTKDFKTTDCLDIDRNALKKLLSEYFTQQDLQCDWARIDGTPDERLMTCLAMVCPFDPGEKQALLETVCCRERAQKFMSMLKMALHQHGKGCGCH